MKWGVLGIELFAIIASYLIITLPTASGTTVNIYGGMSSLSATYKPWPMLKKEIVINPPWDSPTVSIAVSNSTPGAVVESVLLYRCRGMNPSACVSAVEAESSQGNLRSEFAWSSLADQTASYLQVAGILVMARVNSDGKPFWTGFWTEIERGSEQGFEVSEDELDYISVYVDNIEHIHRVKEFITGNHMIPVNPLWVSRIVLVSATSMHELGLTQPGDVEGQHLSGDEVSSVSSNYTFMLPDVSGIRNPVVLYRNPSYICGDSRCEDGSGGTEDRGEGSSNCCLDCPCGGGYYCDSHWGCRPESGIVLGLYEGVPSGVSNCYESHELCIPVEIQNAPSGMSMVSAWYSLRNEYHATSCTHLSGSIYSCPVTVPAMDGCTEGVFTLGPNRIGVRISFMDGAQSRGMELETGLPDITIGSFTCGQGGCETVLGEDQENCCYDCPCSAGYCDYEAGGLKTDAYCRQDPQESDIRAAGIEPDHFSVFSESGETVDMNIIVNNAPRGLGVSATSCDTECMKGEGGESCTAACHLTGCSELASSDPERHNMSCTLSLNIDSYDRESDYTLSPSMDFTLSYNDGPDMVTRSMTNSFRDISVGAQRCGDRDCTGNEGYTNCCYDCPCPVGQYCDTRNIDGPTRGADTCKPLSGTGLIIDGVGGLYLEDSTQPQSIKIRGHVPDPASGFAISGTCSLANDPNIGCGMYCQGTGYTDSGYGIECDIRIPPIGYTSAGLPYYDGSDPDNRVLRLQPNSYNITVAYNDGHDKSMAFYEGVLGTVEITVTSHCGNGDCEEDLGEDQAGCCLDCGCSDYGEGHFCYTGVNPSTGNCVKNDTILLEMVGFDPYPLGCTIGYIGSDCEFSQIGAHVRVTNAPPDIEVIGASYILEGQDGEKTTCVPGEEHGNFTCPLLPDSMEGTEGTETRALNISLYIRYHIGDMEVLQSINASTEEEITREKSGALASCEDEIARLQGMIDSLGSNADEYDSYSKLFMIMGVALMVAFVYCIYSCYGGVAEPSPKPCVPIPGVTLCVQGIGDVPIAEGPSLSLAGEPVAGGNTLGYSTPCAIVCMPLMTMAMMLMMFAQQMSMTTQNTDMQRQGLEMQLEQKRAICSSEGFSGMSDAASGMPYIPMF